MLTKSTNGIILCIVIIIIQVKVNFKSILFCEIFKEVRIMFYTVGEMAKKLHIPTSTLRYYDKEGLLPFVERTQSGIRMFKDSDYEWLQIIECLKKTGMSLADIKEYMNMAAKGDATIQERLQMFLRRREEVERQLEELRETLSIINYKVWFYETAQKAGTTNGISEIEDVPDEFKEVRKKLHKIQ
mgnify:CR=1 FL=1